MYRGPAPCTRSAMVKRKRPASTSSAAKKRCKIEDTRSASTNLGGSHTLQPLLNNCYREVKTLKNYLLDALPTTSRVRRKRILSFPDESQEHSELLNNSLVGLFGRPPDSTLAQRQQQLAQFTQTRRATQPHSATDQQCTLDEVSQKADLCVMLIYLPGNRIRHINPLQTQQWRSPKAKSHPLPRARPLSHL